MALTRTRIVLVGVIGAVLAIMAGRVFDQLEPVVLVGAVFPVVAALATLGRSTTSKVLAAAAAVGAAIALAVLVAGGRLPSDAVEAVLRGAPRVLSTEWPSPRTPDLVGAVTGLVAVATAIAAALAGIRRAHLAPLVPLLLAFVVLVAASAPDGAALVAGAAAGVVALAFVLVDADVTPRQRLRAVAAERRLLPGLGVAVVVAVAATLGLSMTGRADPRDDSPARDRTAALDPIEAVKALQALDPPIDLYRVELDADSGVRRWRTAAVDTFDGERWRADVTLRPIGRRLSAAGERTSDVAIEFLTDDLDLVPLPGTAVTIEGAVETDVGRHLVRTAERPEAGTRLAGEVDLMPDIADGGGGTLATRPVDAEAAALTSAARTLVQPGPVLDQLGQLERTMRTEWALDPDAPGAGVQQALIERFVRDTRRGSAEQFVTAFVLLTRSLGADARVASGFVIPEDEADTTATLRSDTAAVWPEVLVEGVGWVPFDPVPPDEASDLAPAAPTPLQRLTPIAPQPPVVPRAEPADDPPDPDEADDDGIAGVWRAVLRWVVRVGLASSIIVIPLAVAAGAVLWLKRRRRRRLLGASSPADRARGAWAVATDVLTDAGMRVDRSWTDRQAAERGARVAAGAGAELSGLATMSSAATFGRGFDLDPTPYALACVAIVEAAALAPRTRTQRVRYRLSTRSLRRRTRSPISAAVDVHT